MTDPRLEDHAVGVELQITELVEQRERALVQGRHDQADALQPEIEALHDDLAVTAERIADETVEPAVIDDEEAGEAMSDGP